MSVFAAFNFLLQQFQHSFTFKLILNLTNNNYGRKNDCNSFI